MRAVSAVRVTLEGQPDRFEGGAMPTIEETVEVHVPVGAAYDQWTQFEEFPRFMEGVREVRRIDDTRLRWGRRPGRRRRRVGHRDRGPGAGAPHLVALDRRT